MLCMVEIVILLNDMRKPFRVLVYITIFIVTTYIFGIAVDYHYASDGLDNNSGWDGFVEMIIWFFAWGLILIYFLMKKMTSYVSKNNMIDGNILTQSKNQIRSIAAVLTILILIALCIYLGVI